MVYPGYLNLTMNNGSNSTNDNVDYRVNVPSIVLDFVGIIIVILIFAHLASRIAKSAYRNVFLTFGEGISLRDLRSPNNHLNEVETGCGCGQPHYFEVV